MRFFRKFELAVLIGLIVSTIFSFASFEKRCDSVRHKILRMHVIANSDTQEDQKLKLLVRDAVLEEGKKYFQESTNINQAESILKNKTYELTQVAKKTVFENGFDYDVKIEVGKSTFNTRVYDELGITLPAGEYEAVKVIIGEGKGHNWWCVMFPPMCIPAAENDIQLKDILSEKEMKLVESDENFEPRFKMVELLKKITGKI